jgi:hypothetical protein
MPTFEDYDTISDTIDWLGQSVQYKFVTKLSSKDKNGNRTSFHREYAYSSTYNDTEMAYSIKRSFDYYVTLESIDKSTYIQIRQQNMIMMQNILNQVVSWLFNESYWAVKNKILVLKGKPKPLIMNYLPMNKWLSFELIVIEYNNQFDKGIRICLSDESIYVDVRIDNFMGFVYYMNTLNMYQCALSIVNYLQRPSFGTNMVTFDNQSNRTNNFEGEVYSKGSRTIEPAKQQRSFFSKVDKLG